MVVREKIFNTITEVFSASWNIVGGVLSDRSQNVTAAPQLTPPFSS